MREGERGKREKESNLSLVSNGSLLGLLWRSSGRLRVVEEGKTRLVRRVEREEADSNKKTDRSSVGLSVGTSVGSLGFLVGVLLLGSGSLGDGNKEDKKIQTRQLPLLAAKRVENERRRTKDRTLTSFFPDFLAGFSSPSLS